MDLWVDRLTKAYMKMGRTFRTARKEAVCSATVRFFLSEEMVVRFYNESMRVRDDDGRKAAEAGRIAEEMIRIARIVGNGA